MSRVFDCAGIPGATVPLENEYITNSGYGPCWFHTGHHTYDLGGPMAVGALTNGRATSVEVQFTPPAEPDTTHGIALVLESSLDGRTWSAFDSIRYAPTSFRQDLKWSSDGEGLVARYIRIRQPQSAAQGLSGYLDGSGFTAELTPVVVPTPAPRTGTFTLGCADDIMERFFHLTHPCWFGGINRYDSPSVFHTYPLDSTLEVASVTGTATFLPWRSDDYNGNGGGLRSLKAHVFASVDGERWTKLTTFDAQYGLPATFSATGPFDAAYIQIVAEYHRGVKTHPALKHVRGMLFDSSLTVTAA